jgi:dTMP kinase
MLIAFEGIDGSGKSMQAQLLGSWLKAQHEEVTQSAEPTRGKWGKILRHSFTTQRLPPQQELQAFINDRHEHVKVVIKPALERKEVVIIDRYYYSTVAYQGARGFDPKELLALNEKFAPKPDIVFLVDLDPQVALKRIAAGRAGGPDLLENLDTQTKARATFRELAMTEGNFKVLNGMQDPRELTDQVRAHYTVVKKAKEGPQPGDALPSLHQSAPSSTGTCAKCGAMSEMEALVRQRKCEWCGAPYP